MTLKILHKRSSSNGNVPSPSELEYGEIGINYNSNQPGLYIKDNTNVIRRVGGEAQSTVTYFQPVTINENGALVKDPFDAPWQEDVTTTNIPIPTGATGFTLISRSRCGLNPLQTLTIENTPTPYATYWVGGLGFYLRLDQGGQFSDGSFEKSSTCNFQVAPVATRSQNVFAVRFDTGIITSGTNLRIVWGSIANDGLGLQGASETIVQAFQGQIQFYADA